MRIQEHVAVRGRLEDLDVRAEKVGEKERKVEDELLVRVGRGFVRSRDVCPVFVVESVSFWCETEEGRTDRWREGSSC